MKAPSRGLQISRRGWLLAGLLAPLFPARAADFPLVTSDGDNLHISSLGVHFLQGKSLTRLKQGSTVEYVATVGLFRDRQFTSQFKRIQNRYFVSYDIWGTGDLFSATTPGPPARRSTDLPLSATETWCMERISVPVAGIAKDQEFWLQLELRAVPPPISVLTGSGIHVDLLEAIMPAEDERQRFQRGPLKLSDLPSGGRRG
jgi:hypothetical protein